MLTETTVITHYRPHSYYYFVIFRKQFDNNRLYNNGLHVLKMYSFVFGPVMCGGKSIVQSPNMASCAVYCRAGCVLQTACDSNIMTTVNFSYLHTVSGV